VKKSNRLYLLLLCAGICCTSSLYSRDEGVSSISLERAATVSLEKLKHADDEYWEGYLQALLDMNYNEYCVKVTVNDRVVYLAHLPENRLLANSIIAFIEDFPGLKKTYAVKEDKRIPPNRAVEVAKVRKEDKRPKPHKTIHGIWFPQSTVLFEPLLADPRQICFSGAYRWDDNAFQSNVIAVSFGDYFPIYRWRDIGPWRGDMQIDIEAGVWAVFTVDPKVKVTEDEGVSLDNADYYMAIPVTYAVDNWSFRLLGYHVSSHLGDEFLLTHPDIVRVNPSRETIDFFTSYHLTKALRFYGGPGWIVHSDSSFHFKPFLVEYGAELRLLGHRNMYNRVYFQPFFAMHFRNWQEYDWDFDITYVIGVEWSQLQGVGRKVRVFAEWHNGFSLDGQFEKMRDDYFSLNLAWGF
jgi:hypothetical protein